MLDEHELLPPSPPPRFHAVVLTPETYTAWFNELWETTPGSTAIEKADWLREHGSGSEWALMKAEYIRHLNRTMKRRVLPLPDRDTPEVPRPLSHESRRLATGETGPRRDSYWTRQDRLEHQGSRRSAYDTGLGVSYLPDDDDEDTRRWRRRKEAA